MFLRKSSFDVSTFGQFQLIISLLLFTFNVSVNPYFIDISCHHYKGRDISNDIQDAIDEVQGMAVNGLNRLTQGDRNSGPLMQNLFGTDPERWDTVNGYFASMSQPPITDDDFGVMCDDLMVDMQNNTYHGDQRGVWEDIEHGTRAMMIFFHAT